MSATAVAGAARLEAALARAAAERRLGLVAYVMAGFPDLPTSLALADAALDAGADVVELGVPFSDPLADGATIQRAGERALRQGVRVRDVIELARRLATERGAAVLLMGYLNPFHRYGVDRLVHDLRDAGAAGVIVPDLPAGEEDLDQRCAEADIVLVPLVAPTTPDERIRRIVPTARGFVYCVSLTGVTGARAGLPPELGAFVARVRPHARVPIAVGFGISRPDQVRALSGVADAVVVGSAIVDAVDAGADPIAAVRALVAGLRDACA